MSPLRNSDRQRKRGRPFLLPLARFASSSRPARFSHLHLRHDRRAQGRDAHTHEFLLQRLRCRPRFQSRSRQRRSAFVPSARPRLRPHSRLHLYLSRHHAGLRRVRRIRSPGSARSPSHHHRRRPRFFEKIYARLVEQGSKTTGLKRMIFDWAMSVARRATPWRATGAAASFALKAQWKLADKLVYKKIRIGTGGRLRIVSSGGAPLSKDLTEFFWTVGIPIYQGYGLTETSPIVSSNYPVNRMGSSGKPIPNVQVRAAEDGEILVKGPCVMQGYYKNAEATREVLSEDGWFRTGDIGYVDKDNYLFITDRKKDLLKTAAGKFVAPQPIENALRTSPYILNAMVVGD